MFKEMFTINENKFISDAKDDLLKMVQNLETSDENKPKVRKDAIKYINKIIKDIDRGVFRNNKEAQLDVFKELKVYIDALKFKESGIAWKPGMIISEFGLYVNP